jgi:hypothetical protein
MGQILVSAFAKAVGQAMAGVFRERGPLSYTQSKRSEDMKFTSILAGLTAALVSSVAVHAFADAQCPGRGAAWSTGSANYVWYESCSDGPSYINSIHWEEVNISGFAGESLADYVTGGSNPTSSAGNWWSIVGVRCNDGNTYWSSWEYQSGSGIQCPSGFANAAYLSLYVN